MTLFPLDQAGMSEEERLAAAEILRMDSVDFVRESRQILTDINLAVHAGERWALIGPNGAGKSTILSMRRGSNFWKRWTTCIVRIRSWRPSWSRTTWRSCPRRRATRC